MGDGNLEGLEGARGLWILLGSLAAIAVTALGVTLLFSSDGHTASAASAIPPPVTVVVTVPPPAPVTEKPKAPPPKKRKQKAAERRFRRNDAAQTVPSNVSSFYPIYEVAQKTYGVSWLLLASIHKQETAFSTSKDTYFGLNFANCCAGPMQFNVTNGPISTWQRFGNAYRYGKRPAQYGHRTPDHPSVYDDFDSIMAAAFLLRTSGAQGGLDGAAWRAAYDYYGHDLTGVDYANHVLARAIGWAKGGFCVNCEADPNLVARVNAAYGAPLVAAAQARR